MNFRCHKPSRTDLAPSLQRWLTEPKISYEHIGLGVKQYVLRFEVQMAQTELVDSFYSFNNLVKEISNHRLREESFSEMHQLEER